jgi:hypothetical protein
MRTVVSRLPRTLGLLLALSALAPLAACDMDSYSSNPQDRDTHMGDLKAANPPATVSAPPAAAPVSPPPSH